MSRALFSPADCCGRSALAISPESWFARTFGCPRVCEGVFFAIVHLVNCGFRSGRCKRFLGRGLRTMVLSETRRGAGLTPFWVLRGSLGFEKCLGMTVGTHRRANGDYSSHPCPRNSRALDRERDTSASVPGFSALALSVMPDRTVFLFSIRRFAPEESLRVSPPEARMPTWLAG